MRKHGKVVKTGFAALDRKLQGLQGSDLIILAGPPSVGKTALVLNIASNVILTRDRPQTVAIFSLKASKNALMTRLIASEAKVNLKNASRGYFRREQWADLTKAAERFTVAPLYIDDSSTATAAEIRSRTKRLAAQLRASRKRLGLLIVDNLQLIADPRPLTPGAPVKGPAEGAEIVHQLKALASSLNIPVIVLTSIRRGSKIQRSRLDDLGDSKIAQDADIVAFLSREGDRAPAADGQTELARIIIAKNSRGKTGSITLRYSKEQASFLP